MSSPIQSPPRGEADDWKPYVVVGVILATVISLNPLQPDSFGTIDFIQYWSAWELMLQGRNPYDPSLLHATQSALIDGESKLVYSWNPPLTYTLLAPFLTFPFAASATIWLVFEMAALLFIAAKAPKALKVTPLGPVWGTGTTLAFLPTLLSLSYGQLGIFFALSVTCFLLTVNNKNYRLAGLSLLPLSAKPHLFLLCVIPGIVWLTQIPRTARRDFLIASCTGAAFLALATMLIQPHAFMWWFQSMTADVSSTSGLVPYQNWMAHTTASGIRILALALTGTLPTWPLAVVPLTAGIATSLYFFFRRPSIEWSTTLPSMLCLSLATSSYGWAFDQTALVLCNYLLVARAVSCANRIVGRRLLLAVISVQVIPFVLIEASLWRYHWFLIFPWVYLALLLATQKLTALPSHSGATR
jgi:hypothetical protein